MSGAVMAKKRAESESAKAIPKRKGRPALGAEQQKGSVFSIRGSLEWRDWVNRLAVHKRLKVADVIDQALIRYAEEEGFDEKAPMR
jgi:hypothetical protein